MLELLDTHRPHASQALLRPTRHREGSRHAGDTALTLALIGTFPPKKCGIATFTSDIAASLAHYQPDVALHCCPIRDRDDPLLQQSLCGDLIRNDRASYARLARRLDRQGLDAVWLQHEYGIFGGPDGDYVLDLVNRLATPLVVTLHTILRAPTPGQERVMRRLLDVARQVMVMNRSGRDLLIARYGAKADQISLIDHGAPDCPFRLSDIGPAGVAKTLMTFGLLSPGKGLETAIEALPAIAARHPETVYRIVGVTHPNEVRANGERYRRELQARAEQLGVAAHVEWIDRFVDMAELVALLRACDIYLTPYPNLQQSTSGTLSYAVALGRAVVSTPYAHAEELLGDIGGVLVPPGDPQAIAEAVNALLDDPARLAALQRRTYRRGRTTTWAHFAGKARDMLRRAAVPTHDRGRRGVPPAPPGLAAFEALCDGTGILQHGRGIVPDRDHGYCLDDNVRALMLVNRLDMLDKDAAFRLSSRFAAFIQHAWNTERGAFRNFMRYDRQWCEEEGSPDSNGRAIWALGDTALASPLPAISDWALERFGQYAPVMARFDSPRALAFAGLGAVAVLAREPHHAAARALGERCATTLARLLDEARRPGWTWFEPVVAYDNARLPEALIACGAALDEPRWTQAGFAALRWLMKQQFPTVLFRPAGSDGFGAPGEFFPFDQQPLEAWATIDACARAITLGDASAPWHDYAARAWHWFFGENDRAAVLADPSTGICLDGVTRQGANGNCGAESLLAYHLAAQGHAAIARYGNGRCDDAPDRHERI